MDSLNPYNPFENKKKGAHYNQEQIDFLKQLVDQGWSAHKIGQVYGVSPDAIRRRIKDNYWLAAKKNRNGSLSAQELSEIKAEVDEGIDYESICEKHQIAMSSLLNRIANNKWERKHRGNTYKFDEHYFDEITTFRQAYWLGFLYADGYILSARKRADRPRESQSFGFAIAQKDNELLLQFKKDLCADNPIHYYANTSSQYTNSSNYGRILLTSQHTVEKLKGLGVRENKTFFLSAPPIDKALIPAFILGYSDGDGSIIIDKNNKYQWQLCGTKELLTFIQEFFGTNIKLEQRWPERENNNYTLHYCGNQQVPKLLDVIYKDATFCLKRKYNKYAEMRGIVV